MKRITNIMVVLLLPFRKTCGETNTACIKKALAKFLAIVKPEKFLTVVPRQCPKKDNEVKSRSPEVKWLQRQQDNLPYLITSGLFSLLESEVIASWTFVVPRQLQDELRGDRPNHHQR